MAEEKSLPLNFVPEHYLQFKRGPNIIPPYPYVDYFALSPLRRKKGRFVKALSFTRKKFGFIHRRASTSKGNIESSSENTLAISDENFILFDIDFEIYDREDLRPSEKQRLVEELILLTSQNDQNYFSDVDSYETPPAYCLVVGQELYLEVFLKLADKNYGELDLTEDIQKFTL
ncbi:hypothetical protein Zmor_016297 [Zophobas morio]|uniref:Uncharacterized protein n=1 Tax=Zophobas morio TaxID=2755281 RepID=A0AA38HHA9_9CUCU|nr:hypothetical protein Zmor_016297 [Zophobas morio]